MPVTPQDVLAAHGAIQAHIQRTPTIAAPRLSEMLGAQLWLKLENLQFTGSFKDRGSCLKLQRLAQQPDPPAGVAAASAGNHAQGVAYHARRLGMHALIVMPLTTPFSKIERTEGLGAEVVLRGESVAESTVHAKELAAQRGYAFVHPYDDPLIVAGQGTAAIEMLADRPDLEALVVPIGGGGLCAGMALWAKHHKPSIKVYGVQTAMCPSMHARLKGLPMPPLHTHTLAEGIAVKTPGEIPAAILQSRLEDVLLVDETDVETAVQVLAAQQKVVAEGAGAAGVAAVMKHAELFARREVGVVVCGGNIDRRMLSTVLLRGLKRDGKVAKLRISIQDVPGVLARVTQMIGAAGADIIEIEHQRLFTGLAPRQAELDVVMETRGKAHVEQILASLQGAGFPAQAL
ncbi:MAG: threonine ammonia-lyase [Phycisphaerales bacterium]|jgi:threonine dehydratase|nr:threonine ammonia-lyase [Phycisphaerales bacterium]